VDIDVDPSSLAALDRDECLALLATARLGRIVFTDRALPAVRPVRFDVRGDTVRLHPVRGDEPIGAAKDAVLAFEVDSFSSDLSTGWFVVVLGRGHADGIRIELIEGWRVGSRPTTRQPE